MSIISREEYLRLCQHLGRLAGLYYDEGIQEIPDSEYDTMFNLVQAYEKANPTDVSPVSPTQTVGSHSRGKTYPHRVRMYSLSNAMDIDDVREWVKPIVDGWGKDVEFVGEPKYDGMASELIYVDGELREALKRGDGVEGEAFTPHARVSRHVYEQIPVKETISIFGEFVISGEGFDRVAERREAEGLEPYANKRSAVAGIINSAVPFVDSEELAFIPYGLDVEGMIFSTYSEKMDYLRAIGYATGLQVALTSDQIEHFIKRLTENRSAIPYDLDGLVFKVNSVAAQKVLGHTASVPRWAIAYKFEPEKAIARIMSVIYQVGRTGEICPVAKIHPVKVGGVTITSVQLHNEAKLLEYNLHAGDEVEVYRSADCIPKFGMKVKTAEGIPCYEFTKVCPSCSSEIVKIGAIHYCQNPECPGTAVDTITYATSKECLNVVGLGESTAKQLYNEGLVSSVYQIFDLKAENLETLPGFTAYSANKLLLAINRARQQPLWRYLVSLGIPDVGRVTAQNLANAVNDIEKLFELDTPEKVLELKVRDVGETTAQSVATFFSGPALSRQCGRGAGNCHRMVLELCR
jgi:DNA ligase (NAD+)